MSKGPGRIQRAIATVFAADPNNAFTTEELAERAFAGVNRVEKKHRVAVLRSAKSLSVRDRRFSWLVSEGLGGQSVFFDRYNVLSYAMARLKADNINMYRTNDARLCWASAATPESPYGFKLVPGRRGREKSEAELRASLAEGGKHHKDVIEGGAWWKHVRLWTAERDGGTELVAERERGRAAFRAGLSA